MTTRDSLQVLGLVVFTLIIWGVLVWLFGDWGLLLVVISGFTLPLWGWVVFNALDEHSK